MTVLDLDIHLAYENFLLEVTHRFPLSGITALFGPSGSGKSTLLRIIAGLESGAEGRVTFGDTVWQSENARQFVKPHRREVGYVFQDARLFPHLTVAGNLRYSERRTRGQDRGVGYREVVDILDLDGLLNRWPTSLSGGEQQRVAIGRTLLTRPRLLLLDEPLANLDVRRKGEILPYIERLSSVFGTPAIYVTHAVEEVVQLADRIVVLSNGRVAAVGPVAEILERLDLQLITGRFEAGVVLFARVIGHDATFALTRLDHYGQEIAMPQVDLPPGTEVRLRVRARDVALATEPPRGLSIRNVLKGKIVELEEEAATAFAEVLVDLGQSHLRARITRAAVADLGLRLGSPVYALIKSIAFDHRALAGQRSSGRAVGHEPMA